MVVSPLLANLHAMQIFPAGERLAFRWAERETATVYYQLVIVDQKLRMCKTGCELPVCHPRKSTNAEKLADC